MILTSCNLSSKHNGFKLQQFTITNFQLKSVTQVITDSLCMPKKDEVIVLLLGINDSIPEFCFTSAKIKDVSNDYIYLDNRRIVGFINNNGKSIIVLSTEPNKFIFESIFYEFLIPTNRKEYFWYIKFPDNQYHVNKQGIGYPPYAFDPFYHCYTYKENEIVPIIRSD
jgi:hypothetical protein